MKRRNSVRKSPKVPSVERMSIQVGLKLPHETGRKSRCSEVTMMTKRSNHMPMLTKMVMMNSQGMLVRHALEPEDLRHEHVARDHDPVGPPVVAERAVEEAKRS
jgi:hypothetical protein